MSDATDADRSQQAQPLQIEAPPAPTPPPMRVVIHGAGRVRELHGAERDAEYKKLQQRFGWKR